MPPEEKKGTTAQKAESLPDSMKETFGKATIADQMDALRKKSHLFEQSDIEFLNFLAEQTRDLHTYVTENDTAGIEKTVRAIQETYPDQAERLSTEIQEHNTPGSFIYNEHMEMLMACNTTLTIARQYTDFAARDGIVGDVPAKAGDPLETVRDTLSLFSHQLNPNPSFGKNTKEFTYFYNVLEDAASYGSLEKLHEAASAYAKKGDGVFSGKVGRQRVEMAKRVCEFLESVDYKSYEPEIQQKQQEREAKIREEILSSANSAAAAVRLDDKVMDKIHDRCMDLGAEGTLQREQWEAIMDKARNCTFGQKEFMLKFLETKNWVKGFLANGSSPAEIDRNFDKVLSGEGLEISADEAIRREYERQTGAPVNETDRDVENHASTDIDADNVSHSDTSAPDMEEPEVLE